MKARLNQDNTAVVAERYNHKLLKKDVYPSTIPALKIFTAAMWAEHNVFDVVENEPAYDPETHKAVSTGVAVELGVPVRQYSLVALTADEITAKADALAANIRNDRDQRIALTDWTGMSDVTMTAEMSAYRQALRDITIHANFPDLETEDWPVSP